MRARALLLLALAVGAAALAWAALDDPAPYAAAVPELPVAAAAACAPSEPVLLNGDPAALAEGKELLLASNNAVRQRVCGPGTLRFVARGSVALGQATYLVVSLGTETLWEGPVEGAAPFELEVPRAGWLAVAFVNDAYQPPEDRNLWLSAYRFEPR